MSSEEYIKLTQQTYHLITQEFDDAEKSNDITTIYPKLVVMYNFIRLLRGEAFIGKRPVVGDFQKELYVMEDALAKRLYSLKEKIQQDKTAQYHYELFFEDTAV